MDDRIFSDWLQKELDKKGWSQSDLARISGLSRQVISRYINQERLEPKGEMLEAIAKAFGYPVEDVYRAAGLLPELPDWRQAAEEILGYKLSELSDEEIDDLLLYIEFVQSKRGRKPTRKNREGVTPPEVMLKK